LIRKLRASSLYYGSKCDVIYDIMNDMNSGTQTTTIRLPKFLYEQARKAVTEAGVAASLNEFLVDAVAERLRQFRNRQIDAAFAGMAEDEAYRQEATALELSDWEAYRFPGLGADAHEPSRSKKKSAKTTKR
jgi:hypothetical protein